MEEVWRTSLNAVISQVNYEYIESYLILKRGGSVNMAMSLKM